MPLKQYEAHTVRSLILNLPCSLSSVLRRLLHLEFYLHF